MFPMKVLRLAAVLLALAVAVSALAKNAVSGSLVAKGKPVRLQHAYAYWKTPWNDKTKSDLHVLLTDVPLEVMPKDDAGLSKVAALVREDKLHAVELRFAGDATGALHNAEQGAIFHNAIAPARMGASGVLRYEQVGREGKTLQGKVGFDPAMVENFGWTVDATFEVDVPAKE